MLGALALTVGLAGTPFAVFWSGERTVVVDADKGKMYSAPGWYASDDDGRVWRYRLRVATHRHPKGLESEIWPASRWTVFERAEIGNQIFEPLTPIPTTPAPGQGYLQDEVSVLQFRGDTVSLLLTHRQYDNRGPVTTLNASTYRLPSGSAEPVPKGSAEAIQWVERTLPEAVDACTRRPAGALTWELPGGIEARQLLLAGSESNCADQLKTLPLGTVLDTGGGLAWRDAHPHLKAVDARPNTDGTQALFLTGAPLKSGLRGDPCAARPVGLWRDGEVKILGDVLSLTGARWMPDHDPLLAQLPLRFRNVTALEKSCTRPVVLGGRLPRQPHPSAHLCRIDENKRAWAGPADLSGSLAAALEGDTLRIAVTVVDPDRDAADGVQVWVGGDQSRAIHMKLKPSSVEVWGNRKTRQRVKAAVRTHWEKTPQGYRVEATMPRAMAGKTPALAVRIDDVDPGVPGKIQLWVGGHRVTGYRRRPVAAVLR